MTTAESIQGVVTRYPDADPHAVVTLARDTSTGKALFTKAGPVADWQWYVLARDRARPIRTHLAGLLGDDRVPEHVAERLAADDEPEVRKLVASNLTRRPDLLTALAGDLVEQVRVWAIRNRHTPIDAVRHVTDDPHNAARIALAWREDLPLDLMKVLARDKHEEVRANLARHPDLPEGLQYTLGWDKRAGVRAVVATRTDTPTHMLLTFAVDKATHVRQALARRHAYLPDIVVDLLMHDQDDIVLTHVRVRRATDAGNRPSAVAAPE